MDVPYSGIWPGLASTGCASLAGLLAILRQVFGIPCIWLTAAVRPLKIFKAMAVNGLRLFAGSFDHILVDGIPMMDMFAAVGNQPHIHGYRQLRDVAIDWGNAGKTESNRFLTTF